MRAPLEELHAFALSYRSLSAEAVTDLEQAAFADSEAARAAMAARLGGAVEEVGIVQKCNAVVVVVVAAARHNPRFIRQRTLDCWDQLANGTILPILPKVRCYSGLDAAQFLVECAVGLHSLVVGDSQVLHQMTAIAPPGSDRRSTVLGRLAQAMKQLAQEVREQTGLNDGELSAERLACARVTAHVAGDAGRILVVGAGRSADLVTKILAQEERRDVVVVNRSLDGARSVAERRGATHEQIDAAPALAGVSAVVLAVPRDDESVGFAGQLLTGLTDRHPGALVADLSPRPLVAYDRFRVVPLTLATIAREAREHSAARQGSVSQAHELIRKRLPQLAEDVDPRARSMATAALRPLPSEKRQLIGERAGILAALRELLARRGFDEIITPCVVDMPSDPPRVGDEGAFALDWLGRGRFLRQSNQVYKQMAVAAGAERVYEIGPVWRRETALSPRHLYESTGLDAEWRLDDGLDEVLALAFEVVVAAAAVTPTDVRLPAAGEVPAISYAAGGRPAPGPQRRDHLRRRPRPRGHLAAGVDRRPPSRQRLLRGDALPGRAAALLHAVAAGRADGDVRPRRRRLEGRQRRRARARHRRDRAQDAALRPGARAVRVLPARARVGAAARGLRARAGPARRPAARIAVGRRRDAVLDPQRRAARRSGSTRCQSGKSDGVPAVSVERRQCATSCRSRSA